MTETFPLWLKMVLVVVSAMALALATLPLTGTGLHAQEDEGYAGPIHEVRLEGTTRFQTAAEIATSTYAAADEVLIASGQEFPDALAGASLSGTLRAPILLVPPDLVEGSIPDEITEAIDELGAETATFLGGTAAVSAEVEAYIQANSSVLVTHREAGATRFHTAREIAEAVHTADPGAGQIPDDVAMSLDVETGTVGAFLATGLNFPDSLAAGPGSFVGQHPVLLTTPDSLHAQAEAGLESFGADVVFILGGGAVVSADIEDQLEANGYEVVRLGGADRWETASIVADTFAQDFGFGVGDIGLATGFEFADALASAPYLGENDAPTLLTPSNSIHPVTEAWFNSARCNIGTLHAFGGELALNQAVADAYKETACPDGPVEVTLLHDTHTHGDFGPEDGPNIARYSMLARQLKRGSAGALFVGNGDDLAPSVMASVFRGAHMIEAFNAGPLDVNTLGNHEFDFGPDNARDQIADSEFRWVSANVRDVDDEDEPFAADLGVDLFTTFNVRGVEVGVTGLGPENMPEVTSLTATGAESGAQHIPSVEAMQEVVPMMEAADVDLIVVASHLCGPDARDLAAAVDGIDAILGDHCAEVLDEPEVINDTIVSFVGDEYDFIGELTVTIEDGERVGHDFTLHELTADIIPDRRVEAIVSAWEQRLDEALNEVIGERTNAWDVQSPDPVRRRETPFANYITDTMRDSFPEGVDEADVSLQNGGGIRSGMVYEPGEIILRDVIAILPFPNTVVKVEIEGAALRDALENGVSNWEAGDGRFPHVSGMEYVWDPDGDPRDPDDPEVQPGNRIVDVTINGDPLDDTATYTLATNDFLLGGGDGYTMFADIDEDDYIIGPGESRLLSEVVADRIRDEETVTVDTDGRISEVNDD